MPEILTPQKEVKENSEKPLHSVKNTHTHTRLTETHTMGQKSKRKKEVVFNSEMNLNYGTRKPVGFIKKKLSLI